MKPLKVYFSLVYNKFLTRQGFVAPTVITDVIRTRSNSGRKLRAQSWVGHEPRTFFPSLCPMSNT